MKKYLFFLILTLIFSTNSFSQGTDWTRPDYNIDTILEKGLIADNGKVKKEITLKFGVSKLVLKPGSIVKIHNGGWVSSGTLKRGSAVYVGNNKILINNISFFGSAASRSYNLSTNNLPVIPKVYGFYLEPKRGFSLSKYGYIFNATLAKEATIKIQNDRVILKKNSGVTILSKGRIYSGYLKGIQYIKGFPAVDNIRLYDNGNIKFFRFIKNTDYKLQKRKLKLKRGTYISFYKNGNFRRGMLF